MIEALFAGSLVLALGLVARFSYRQGYAQRDREAREERNAAVERAFELGKQTGGDDLANALMAAATDCDPFDVWPAARRREVRPS